MKVLLLLCLFIPSVAFSQSLNGIVKDSDHSPVVDANILNLRSGFHTHSDNNGKFILNESLAGDTLHITHLGFNPLFYIVQQNTSNLEIILQPATLQLSEIVVSHSMNALNHFADIDLKLDPVNSSQEILRKVPGMIIGQHAGGGKAEQIFLRGFDIDHGTDVSIAVDGMPVNMVSHAHGQGYADLHFLIPEVIQTLDFGKGPYYADKGNFATAGYVNFLTYDRLPNNQVFQELGQFNTKRTVGMFNLLNSEKHHAYAAGELYLTDGPFESPQDFSRMNLMGKFTTTLENSKISAQVSHFQSSWNASGQIPLRAIREGLITRFGAIDDTEGGNTSRTNFQLKQTVQPDEKTTVINRAYLSAYDFELFSNFTFFLNDPVNGDQIKQKEVRTIYGLESTLNRIIKKDFSLNGGLGFRHDEISDNELSRTANRDQILTRVALGDIKETNVYGFASAEFTPGKWLINPAIRVDNFNFYYDNHLTPVYAPESESRVLASPKLNVIYSPAHDWQVYAKSGIGFHSNDTRVVVAQNGEEILPKAYGADFGAIWKPGNRLLINTGLWYLFLEQEFVYVGDEGIVEPGGKTKRLGVDVSASFQLTDHLFLSSNLNYSHARAIEELKGEDHIPLAPVLTNTGGLYYQNPNGISGSITYRYVGDRPANEDNSIIAEGYLITDGTINYNAKNWNFGFTMENLFDVEWNETQFATESRLFDEATSVEEIHFTPGTPFFFKARLGFRF